MEEIVKDAMAQNFPKFIEVNKIYIQEAQNLQQDKYKCILTNTQIYLETS